MQDMQYECICLSVLGSPNHQSERIHIDYLPFYSIRRRAKRRLLYVHTKHA